jgi:ATP-dependent Lon protease
MAAKMTEKGVPPHVRKQIEREMRDMGGEEDREVAQKYIDTLMEFPWTQYTPEAKDIVLA